jgi:hypothetical protein
MFEQKRGRLIYRFGFTEYDPIPPPPLGAYIAHIDAHTGRVIQITDARIPAAYMGGGSAAKPTPKPAHAWPALKGRISFAAAGREAAATGDIKPIPVPPRPAASGRRVLVSTGRLFLSALYDPKSGQLWLDRGGKRAYGKPTSATAKALRKVAPN